MQAASGNATLMASESTSHSTPGSALASLIGLEEYVEVTSEADTNNRVCYMLINSPVSMLRCTALLWLRIFLRKGFGCS
jgi:hypothetical protein